VGNDWKGLEQSFRSPFPPQALSDHRPVIKIKERGEGKTSRKVGKEKPPFAVARKKIEKRHVNLGMASIARKKKKKRVVFRMPREKGGKAAK